MYTLAATKSQTTVPALAISTPTLSQHQSKQMFQSDARKEISTQPSVQPAVESESHSRDQPKSPHKLSRYFHDSKGLLCFNCQQWGHIANGIRTPRTNNPRTYTPQTITPPVKYPLDIYPPLKKSYDRFRARARFFFEWWVYPGGITHRG